MNLDKAIKIVAEQIEMKLGGNVVVDKNLEHGVVLFTWKRNDKTIFAEHFQHMFSVVELEQTVNSKVLGEYFVDRYKEAKNPSEVEPLVEESVEEVEPQSKEVEEESVVEEDEETDLEGEEEEDN